MYLFFSFLLGGIAFTIWILEFDRKQVKKINSALRESGKSAPLLMLKSTEQKIIKLKAALDEEPKNKVVKASRSTVYKGTSENKRRLKIQELMLLTAKYNNGLISLEDYNSKLDELIAQVSQNGSLGLVG